MIAKGEELKEELLAAPRRAGVAAVAVGRAEAGDAGAPPTTRTASCAGASTTGCASSASASPTDPELQAKVDDWVERAVGYVVDNYRGEVADLIATTVERWDGADTSRRIELQVGRDLQFIRINGTVVGGLAGLAIHAVSQALF